MPMFPLVKKKIDKISEDVWTRETYKTDLTQIDNTKTFCVNRFGGDKVNIKGKLLWLRRPWTIRKHWFFIYLVCLTQRRIFFTLVVEEK